MKLHTIDTGLFKLDGGAMFGIVPKSIWQKLNPADENNMCTWAMRCLLIEDGNRLTLIDTGIGDKQNEKFFSHYYLHGEANLEGSLKKLGYAPSDITDVLLTHLHFDHCGGAVKWNTSKDRYVCTFENATYHTFRKHWEHATNPNQREKASFLKENFEPIEQNGQLHLLDEDHYMFSENIFLRAFHGHTSWMMVPFINYKDRTIVYPADLMPSSAHINPVYAMGYDIFPLSTLDERKQLSAEAVDRNYVLFYEHDPVQECSSLTRTEKGITHEHFFKLDEL